MNLFSRPSHKPPVEEHDRDRLNKEAQTVVSDFVSEMKEVLKELQETSSPNRKDYPIASALRRGQQP